MNMLASLVVKTVKNDFYKLVELKQELIKRGQDTSIVENQIQDALNRYELHEKLTSIIIMD